MLNVGDRVIIISNTCRDDNDLGRDDYIGCTGILVSVNTFRSFPYDVKFDNAEMRERNENEEGWLWNKDEVMKLEEDNEHYVR